MSNYNELSVISPIDGRYKDKVNELSGYFSEGALMRYRVMVEIEYFIALCKIPIPGLSEVQEDIFSDLQRIYTDFQLVDAIRIKEIEKVTNHDVKAVEYFIKEKFEVLGLSAFSEYIHFGLTSQDINNTAVPYSLKEAVQRSYFPLIDKIVTKLTESSKQWSEITMLARTHGQPASPTRLGKEVAVFTERLIIQLKQLNSIPFSAKFGGATGNFNAHHVAFPGIDWKQFADKFVNETLGLSRSQTTTQIEHYDNMAALFDSLRRINTILTDFARDMWTYISMEYFKQEIREGEVGSSTMPHKVNPIDFENAEGNIGIANALFEHLSAKLPVSRLQRDLTDSTVLRNIGVPIAHTMIAVKSLLKGLNKLIVNTAKIESDLERNWGVVAEAIQTILRREGYPKPYEALKKLTRTNKQINRDVIETFVKSLDVNEAVKEEIMAISPQNYTGIA